MYAGLIRLYDLEDSSAMLDLRIRSEHRGRGIGKQAVQWLTPYVFQTYPNVVRIEGQTRQDNIAMRKIFRACGYVKEAHYRACWKDDSGEYLDSIGYGMLKCDFETGTTTAVAWDDEETF